MWLVALHIEEYALNVGHVEVYHCLIILVAALYGQLQGLSQSGVSHVVVIVESIIEVSGVVHGRDAFPSLSVADPVVVVAVGNDSVVQQRTILTVRRMEEHSGLHHQHRRRLLRQPSISRHVGCGGPQRMGCQRRGKDQQNNCQTDS